MKVKNLIEQMHFDRHVASLNFDDDDPNENHEDEFLQLTICSSYQENDIDQSNDSCRNSTRSFVLD